MTRRKVSHRLICWAKSGSSTCGHPGALPAKKEHPVLVDFARTGVAPVIGLDYKDQRKDALAVLRRAGNPIP